MSQIGYMVLAAGLGPAGYAFAIFHLLTHGFFKAGLFLGAGSVMHGMNDEVNMRRYGALRQAMPITFRHFHGWLSGDHRHPAVRRLLLQGQDHRGRAGREHLARALAAILGAGITALLHDAVVMFMTFFGERAGLRTPIRTSRPGSMTIPMIVLGHRCRWCLVLVLGVGEPVRRLA